MVDPDGAGAPSPPSPVDLIEQRELDDLPTVAGADLDVLYHYVAGPFGEVHFALSFRDGRVASAVLGEVDEPDVEVVCTFLQMAQVRRGDIGILDVLAAGGQVAGSEGALGPAGRHQREPGVPGRGDRVRPVGPGARDPRPAPRDRPRAGARVGPGRHRTPTDGRVTGPMEETVRRLEEEVDEGLFTRGVQVAITHGGEDVLDLALGDDGLGRPMAAGTLLRVYCAIKPVTALAVGRLVDDGALELDAPLHHRLPRYACLSEETTLRHVLEHTAGLHNPPGVTVEMVPPAERVRFLERVPEAPGWRMGHDAAYSEHLGWHLLGRLIEEVTGTPVGEHLRAQVLEPLGLGATYIGMTGEEVAAALPRLGVNVDLRADRAYPMLFERTERVLREVSCGHGGYTTAADLCRLYGLVLRGRREVVDPHLPGPATLTEMTTTQSARLRRGPGSGVRVGTGLHDRPGRAPVRTGLRAPVLRPLRLLRVVPRLRRPRPRPRRGGPLQRHRGPRVGLPPPAGAHPVDLPGPRPDRPARRRSRAPGTLPPDRGGGVAGRKPRGGVACPGLVAGRKGVRPRPPPLERT